MEDDQLTMKEAAALLGVTQEKVTRLVNEGVLQAKPSVLDKRRKLIPRRAVLALKQGEQRAEA